MAAFDVPSNSGAHLRSAVTAEQLARAAHDHQVRQEANVLPAASAAGIAIMLAGAGMFWIYRRRVTMLRAADGAALSAAVGGLKAKRKILLAWKRFAERVRDRASSD